MKTLTFYIFAHDYMSTKKGTEHIPGFPTVISSKRTIKPTVTKKAKY